MKWKLGRLSLPLVLLASCGLAACDDTREGMQKDANDAEREIERTTQAARTELNQEIKEFRIESDKALEKMDAQLERLEAKAEAASEEAKAEAREQLAELKRERAELEKKIDRAEAKTAAEWSETRGELDRGMAKLGRDINHALDKAGDEAEAALR